MRPSAETACCSVPEQQPLVSAVIPTRNRPDLVCRAVRSALQQTYRNIEVVVVIDGPDPATVAALKRVDDSRIRIVALDENVGGAEARNIGVRTARGEFIALLDDDDEWLPEKTAKQIEFSRAHTSALIVCQYFARVSEGREICFPLRFPERGQAISEYMFDAYSGFQTSTFFCKRSKLLEIPFTPGLAGCQDLDWFLRAMTIRNADLRVVPEPLAIFNIPENRPSISRKLSWKFRLQWGRSSRSLMTKRGYSDFILRVCLERMLTESYTIRDFLTLCREYFIAGKPSTMGVLHFFGSVLLPKPISNRVHNTRIRIATRLSGRP